MTVLEYAATLVRVESHCALSRAAMLFRDDKLALEELLRARQLLNTATAAVVSRDETKLYLARS